jgi:tetratricopeptide (TPR) repeat protein
MRILATKDIGRWLSPVAVLALLGAIGCQVPTIPNPNDPDDVGVVSAPVLKRNLVVASTFLYQRVDRGEITDEKAQQLLAATADKMIAHIDLKAIRPESAWEYGDVFRTARRWDLAEAAYTLAVKSAKNDDRRINDTLRLAVCQAHLGKYEEAIKSAQSVLDAPVQESAPILPSILYELVPAARGHGRDTALADVLEQATKKHVATKVDPTSSAGRSFVSAAPHHLARAWGTIVDLYRADGKDDVAQAAHERGIAMLKKLSDSGYGMPSP